jgi:hypothetical protein
MIAVAALALINILGLWLGRGAIVPLLNAAAMGMTVILAMTVFGLLVLKRRGERSAYEVPGGNALVGVAMLLNSLMAIVAFADPWLASDLLQWSNRAPVPRSHAVRRACRRHRLSADDRRARHAGLHRVHAHAARR